jgi:hypothetical protein
MVQTQNKDLLLLAGWERALFYRSSVVSLKAKINSVLIKTCAGCLKTQFDDKLFAPTG